MQHVLISRAGIDHGPVDEALAAQGHKRVSAAVAGGFAAALGLVRGTNFVATVPDRFTQSLRQGLITFPLPVQIELIQIALLWHPRMDADRAHHWLRSLMQDICSKR